MPASPFVKPGFFTARVVNPVVAFLAGRLGLGLKGAQVLAVQGRESGEWHRIPVNPLSFAGQRSPVAPRGETEGVRHIRVSRAPPPTVAGKTPDAPVGEGPDPQKPP